jgi:long-subunit fatty acid transport protein
LLSASATAKGIFIQPGTRANAMGAAYGALADDLTAIYWNPAGLASLKKSGVSCSSFYVNSPAKSNRSLGNSTNPQTADGDFPLLKVYDPALNPLIPAAVAEPAAYASREMSTTAFVPCAGGYATWNDICFATALYGIGGGGGKWSDTVSAGAGQDTIIASLDATKAFMAWSIAAAKPVAAGLSAGASVDLIYLSDSITARKQYVRGAGTFLPADYRLTLDKSAAGYGVQVSGGLLYTVHTTLRTGLVIRSGTDIRMTGTARYTEDELTILGSTESNYDQTYAYPLTYGVSAAYDPMPTLTLAGMCDVTNYSTMKNDVSYAHQSLLFTSQNSTLNWKDFTQYHIGAEYRPWERWSFQAGFENDPAPFDTDNLSLLETSQYAMNYYCLGAGYDLDSVRMYAAYIRGVSDTPAKNGRTFEYGLDIFRLGISHTF